MDRFKFKLEKVDEKKDDDEDEEESELPLDSYVNNEGEVKYRNDITNNIIKDYNIYIIILFLIRLNQIIRIIKRHKNGYHIPNELFGFNILNNNPLKIEKTWAKLAESTS